MFLTQIKHNWNVHLFADSANIQALRQRRSSEPVITQGPQLEDGEIADDTDVIMPDQSEHGTLISTDSTDPSQSRDLTMSTSTDSVSQAGLSESLQSQRVAAYLFQRASAAFDQYQRRQIAEAVSASATMEGSSSSSSTMTIEQDRVVAPSVGGLGVSSGASRANECASVRAGSGISVSDSSSGSRRRNNRSRSGRHRRRNQQSPPETRRSSGSRRRRSRRSSSRSRRVDSATDSEVHPTVIDAARVDGSAGRSGGSRRASRRTDCDDTVSERAASASARVGRSDASVSQPATNTSSSVGGSTGSSTGSVDTAAAAAANGGRDSIIRPATNESSTSNGGSRGSTVSRSASGSSRRTGSMAMVAAEVNDGSSGDSRNRSSGSTRVPNHSRSRSRGRRSEGSRVNRDTDVIDLTVDEIDAQQAADRQLVAQGIHEETRYLDRESAHAAHVRFAHSQFEDPRSTVRPPRRLIGGSVWSTMLPYLAEKFGQPWTRHGYIQDRRDRSHLNHDIQRGYEYIERYREIDELPCHKGKVFIMDLVVAMEYFPPVIIPPPFRMPEDSDVDNIRWAVDAWNMQFTYPPVSLPGFRHLRKNEIRMPGHPYENEVLNAFKGEKVWPSIEWNREPVGDEEFEFVSRREKEWTDHAAAAAVAARQPLCRAEYKFIRIGMIHRSSMDGSLSLEWCKKPGRQTLKNSECIICMKRYSDRSIVASYPCGNVCFFL